MSDKGLEKALGGLARVAGEEVSKLHNEAESLRTALTSRDEEVKGLKAKVQAQAKDIKMLRGAIEEALSESIPEGRAPCEIRMAAALRGEGE